MGDPYDTASERMSVLPPTLKFKGENGIMMKKFAALTKEKDEVSEEIKRMTDKQKGLRGAISELEREIQLLRVTIHEKDVNIAEKEKRIYELKKKNQVRRRRMPPAAACGCAVAYLCWIR